MGSNPHPGGGRCPPSPELPSQRSQMVSPAFAIATHPFLLPHATATTPPFVPRIPRTLKRSHIGTISGPKMVPLRAAMPVPEVAALRGALVDLLRAAPPTWGSAVASNLLIFVLGSPLLVTGLTGSGIAAAFLLGTLTWRAFGPSGFLLVATYFVIGTGATKLKIKQKEALGVAEKRRGRRGPGSVIGSSAAGCVCALLSIYGAGGIAFLRLWRLGFVSSFCTKLSDTVSSEIGKAYGKTTYLVTNLKIVPRGTEGAVSVEGSVAGLLASILLALAACFLGEIEATEAVICVVASQLANLGESIIGASLQDKDGYRWRLPNRNFSYRPFSRVVHNIINMLKNKEMSVHECIASCPFVPIDIKDRLTFSCIPEEGSLKSNYNLSICSQALVKKAGS